MAISKLARGVLNAANDTYHGAQSIKENGAIPHAAAYAKALMVAGKAQTQEEAVAMANHEVQRIRGCMAGEQLNREVRLKLRAKPDSLPDADPTFA